jgi:hypothetical protein
MIRLSAEAIIGHYLTQYEQMNSNDILEYSEVLKLLVKTNEPIYCEIYPAAIYAAVENYSRLFRFSNDIIYRVGEQRSYVSSYQSLVFEQRDVENQRVLIEGMNILLQRRNQK